VIIKTRVRPPGSFLVVAGDIYAPMPEFPDQEERIWANEWCVGVGTLSEVDGETEIVVTDNPKSESLPLVFDGVIAAPDRCVTVSDAYLLEVARVQLRGDRARIKIWTNDPREPDRIVIAVTSENDRF